MRTATLRRAGWKWFFERSYERIQLVARKDMLDLENRQDGRIGLPELRLPNGLLTDLLTDLLT